MTGGTNSPKPSPLTAVAGIQHSWSTAWHRGLLEQVAGFATLRPATTDEV